MKPGDPVPGRRALRKTPLSLICPYCGKRWPRGGRAEGFRVSAAESHATGCRDVALFELGLVRISRGPEDELMAVEHVPTRIVTSLRRLRRTRLGRMPQL